MDENKRGVIDIDQKTMRWIIGGVWKTPSVTEMPTYIIVRWRILAVTHNGNTTHHFVGFNEERMEGKVSSNILEFDPVTHKGRTNSGRIYELKGETGYDDDAQYVLEQWVRLAGITLDDCVNVSIHPNLFDGEETT